MAIFFSFGAWVTKLIMDWKKFKSRQSLSQKLIDRFNNAEELGTFLASESGGKLLDSFEPAEKVSPTRDKLLSNITRAVVLIFLGAAFFLISELYIVDEHQAFGALGIVAAALGLAFVVSTLISFHLSKKWGIINGD
jgi:hypothetical protein